MTKKQIFSSAKALKKTSRLKKTNGLNKESSMKNSTSNKISDLKKSGLSKDLLLKMHDLMVKSRVLEERLIKIYKAGDAYFWIGAPGAETSSTCF